MKGIKDFLSLYLMCFFLTLFALIVFVNVQKNVWLMMLAIAFMAAILLYAILRLVSRVEDLEKRLDELAGRPEDDSKE